MSLLHDLLTFCRMKNRISLAVLICTSHKENNFKLFLFQCILLNQGTLVLLFEFLCFAGFYFNLIFIWEKDFVVILWVNSIWIILGNQASVFKLIINFEPQKKKKMRIKNAKFCLLRKIDKKCFFKFRDNLREI